MVDRASCIDLVRKDKLNCKEGKGEELALELSKVSEGQLQLSLPQDYHSLSFLRKSTFWC